MYVAVQEKVLVLGAEGVEVEINAVGKFYRAFGTMKT
jgi:hypothetical protein